MFVITTVFTCFSEILHFPSCETKPKEQGFLLKYFEISLEMHSSTELSLQTYKMLKRCHISKDILWANFKLTLWVGGHVIPSEVFSGCLKPNKL